jgi:hypothetical protein
MHMDDLSARVESLFPMRFAKQRNYIDQGVLSMVDWRCESRIKGFDRI